MASTAYKRARSLGWGEYSAICAFLIPIHMSVGAWPDSVFESGSGIFIVTIPLYILQLYMVFKNAKPIKSSATQKWYRTGEKVGRIIGEYLYTPIKWKNILIYVGLVLLLKVLLHFSLFPEISNEVSLAKDKIYVDGNATSGWFHKEGNNLKIEECCWVNGTCPERWEAGYDWINGVRYDRARVECWELKDVVYRKKNNPAFTKDGEKYHIEDVRVVNEYGHIDGRVYYYPHKNLGFISHFGLIFKSKLWLFLISFGLTIFLTFKFR